jgi:hypothetical protein
MNNKFISTPGLLIFAGSLLFIVGISCADASRQATSENNTTATKKPPSSFSDTFNIDVPAAVFYSPDSLQLEKIKSLTDSSIFDGSMHEYYYLMRNAKITIAKTMPRLKIIEAKNVRYLFFTGAGKQKGCIDLNSNSDAYGLIVFDGLKAPKVLDMPNVETELWSYFSR